MDSTPVCDSDPARAGATGSGSIHSTKRLVLVVVTLLLALAAVPSVASAGASLSKLRIGGALGAED